MEERIWKSSRRKWVLVAVAITCFAYSCLEHVRRPYQVRRLDHIASQTKAMYEEGRSELPEGALIELRRIERSQDRVIRVARVTSILLECVSVTVGVLCLWLALCKRKAPADRRAVAAAKDLR